MSDKPSRYVLDSHALIAYLEDETGAPRVKTLLAQAEKNQAEIFLAIINYGEVVYITEREQGLVAAQTVIAAIDQLPVTIVEADRKLTFAAASIKAKYPISYADAFVVALARTLDAKILTGDPEFQSLEKLATVEWMPVK